MPFQNDTEAQQLISQEGDAERLAALESDDPSLTPVLAHVVSHFLRREPLPPIET